MTKTGLMTPEKECFKSNIQHKVTKGGNFEKLNMGIK